MKQVKTTLKPGDKLFWNSSWTRWEPEEVEIAKVGRKWATLANGWRNERVDILTLKMGGRHSCKLFHSEAEWMEEKSRRDARIAADKAWLALCRACRNQYTRPTHINAETINRIMRELFNGPA